MKKLIVILFISLFVQNTNAQNKLKEIEGKISYMSSQNIYAKFESTEGISIGDTLFIRIDGTLFPVLEVKYISSKSCSGAKLNISGLEVGKQVIAFSKENEVNSPVTVVKSENLAQVNRKNEAKTIKEKKQYRDSKTIGRYVISSYANLVI